MIRRSAVVAVALCTIVLTAGLVRAGSPSKEAEPYVANFSYTPASRSAPGSGGVAFTIGGAVYVSDEKTTHGADWRSAPQFAQLNASLKEDLSELFVAKGFTVRGPFDTYDLIPYSDKKQIDFYLIPTMELFATFKDTNVETESAGFSGKVYHGTGTIEMTGNLTVKLQEIATRELLWTKSIPIAYTFPYDVRFPYFETGSRPFDMKPVMNDMAKGLEQQYPAMMQTLSDLIDREEMRILKKQAQELKRKKGY